MDAQDMADPDAGHAERAAASRLRRIVLMGAMLNLACFFPLWAGRSRGVP